MNQNGILIFWIIITIITIIIIIGVIFLISRENKKPQKSVPTIPKISIKNLETRFQNLIKNNSIPIEEKNVSPEPEVIVEPPTQDLEIKISNVNDSWFLFVDNIRYNLTILYSYDPIFSVDQIEYFSNKIYILSKKYLHSVELKNNVAIVKTLDEQNFLSSINGDIIYFKKIFGLLLVQTSTELILFDSSSRIFSINYSPKSRRIYGKNLKDYVDFNLETKVLTDPDRIVIACNVCMVKFLENRFDYALCN